jgi:hypothetical protein
VPSYEYVSKNRYTVEKGFVEGVKKPEGYESTHIKYAEQPYPHKINNIEIEANVII